MGAAACGLKARRRAWQPGSSWNDPAMTTCITGGSGFVGSALTRRLRAVGGGVRVLDLVPPREDGVAFHPCDLAAPAGLEAGLAGGRTLVHLAAEHRDDVQPECRYTKVNVDGTGALASAADAAGVERIVFASSVAVYGLEAPGANEATPPAPFNAYGRSKLQAEAVLRDWQARDPQARSLVIVRPCVVFGPGNRGNVHTLFSQIAARRFVMVGDGSHRKSLAYVGNIAAFLDCCTRLPTGVHLFNYADTPDLTVAELVGLARARMLGRRGIGRALPIWAGMALGHGADAVAQITGRRLPVSAVRVRKFLSPTTVDARRAHALPGFHPPFTLTEGLEATLAADFGAEG
jgi:GlcNAc-P-P-Und epimerase